MIPLLPPNLAPTPTRAARLRRGLRVLTPLAFWVGTALACRAGTALALPSQPVQNSPTTVALYVGPTCATCRVQQRVLAAAGLAVEVRSIADAGHHAAVLGALGPTGASRLPAVQIGARWLADDPAWPEVRAALPPGALDPARAGANAASSPSHATRLQWFSRPDAPPCEAARAALHAARIPVEDTDVSAAPAEERMWVTARLLGGEPKAGLVLPFVVLDGRPHGGCPSLGLLAEALPSEVLWAQAETALLAAPQRTGEAVVGALNFARLMPRRYLSEGLSIQRLPPDSDLAGQLSLAPSLEPHRWVSSAELASVGGLAPVAERSAANGVRAAGSVQVYRLRALPSPEAAVARLLTEDAGARAQLLGPETLRVAVDLQPDPLLGLVWTLWVAPAPPGERDPRPTGAGAAGTGSVFRPHR